MAQSIHKKNLAFFLLFISVLHVFPFYAYTVEPRYPDTRFSRHSAYHVSFSKSQFSVHDFNVNKLRIVRHSIMFNSGYPDGSRKLAYVVEL